MDFDEFLRHAILKLQLMDVFDVARLWHKQGQEQAKARASGHDFGGLLKVTVRFTST